MKDREAIAWLHRRAGFGLAPGELDEFEALGAGAVLDRLVDADRFGLAPNPDPWAGLRLDFVETEANRADQRRGAVAAWLTAMVATPRPLEERMRWFWHGHLVSSVADVGSSASMVQQLRTYGALGLGALAPLLRATTVDPAMLVYLNGAGSHRRAPNENYSRELLELFALGLGAYTERDVKAGAAALTGYRVNRATGVAVLDPSAHDDTPQQFLDAAGVNDVDSVIEAVTTHPRCARWITRNLAEATLGAGVDDAVIDSTARGFADDGLELRPLLRRLLEAGLEGASRPAVLAPIPWFVGCLRATGGLVAVEALDRRAVGDALIGAGQLPLFPPNVSGWPGDRAWLSTSATVARFNAAALVASACPDSSAALQFAAERDAAALADSLGRPEGFGASTREALGALPAGASRRPGEGVLAVALASPEMAQA